MEALAIACTGVACAAIVCVDLKAIRRLLEQILEKAGKG